MSIANVLPLAKLRRPWVPTSAANSMFDYTAAEDADPSIESYIMRSRIGAIEAKRAALFGHESIKLLYCAPVSGLEASRDVTPTFRCSLATSWALMRWHRSASRNHSVSQRESSWAGSDRCGCRRWSAGVTRTGPLRWRWTS